MLVEGWSSGSNNVAAICYGRQFFEIDINCSQMNAVMSPFGKNSPAESIHALLEFLQSEHQPGDLYRGQVREYPALIPSMFRAGIISGTADQKVVSVDSERIYQTHSSKADKIRRRLHSLLITKYGIALGNIVAQQYGIRSECIDLTEDIRVAAFFATRRWPEYAHHIDPGIGVIYRFKREDKALSPIHKTNLIISSWFEMGEWEGKYFDVFVRESEYAIASLDRDKWLDIIPRQRAIVSTMPLRVRWGEIMDLIRDLKRCKIDGLWNQIIKYDHRLTRTARQSGGFFRPRFFWEADIPARYKLVNTISPLGPNPLAGMPEFDESAPMVSPSTAIKINLTGVENLRLRDDCEAFYFRHREKSVTGLYRRKLWPEPSEDPLYSLLWQQAVILMISKLGDKLPPVDDLDQGILDRGYRVAGEKQTMDARELDDLMRGQLEDAREAVNGDSPTSEDWIYLSGGLGKIGEKRASVSAAIQAVRCDPYNVKAGIALAGSLWLLGKGIWARQVLYNIESFAPAHPDVLYNLSVAEFEDQKYQSAFSRLKTALKHYDQSEHIIPRYMILQYLLDVSQKLGEEVYATYAKSALERYMWSGGAVVDEEPLPGE